MVNCFLNSKQNRIFRALPTVPKVAHKYAKCWNFEKNAYSTHYHSGCVLQRKEFILPLYIKSDVEGLFENEQNRLIYSYIRAAIYCWLISIMYLGVLACMPLDIGHMPTHMFLFTTLQGISSCENKHFDSGIVVKHCGQGGGALREIYQHERCLWYISSFIPYCMYKVSM